MSMKRPDWIMDKIRAVESKPKPRDQITIIAMNPAGRSGQAMPISTSRMTGAGVDGMVQPGKVAGDVHEGEMVLSANATQALPEDVRTALTQQAEEGSIDVPALRAALKLQDRPGYAIGSFGAPIRMPQVTAPMPIKINPSNETYENSTAPKNSTSSNNSIATPPPITINMPKITTPTRPTPTPIQFAPIIVPAQTVSGELPKVMQTKVPAPEIKPIEIAPVTEPKTITGEIPRLTSQTPPEVTPVNIALAGRATPKPTNYSNIINSSLRRVIDTAEGKSVAEQRIANQGLRNYDTRAASEKDANRMDLALMGDNVPDSAKNAMMAQNASSIRSGRSNLIGDMSANAAERASAANITAANIAGQQQSFNEGVRQYDTNFEENKRVGDRAFNEGVRQYDTNFDENRRVGDRAFNEGVRQYDQNYNLNERQIARTNALADIDTLMAAGAAENMPAIQAKYKELGIDINPEYILNAEKSKRFIDAKAFLATAMAEPGATTEGVIAAANAAGYGDVLNDAFGGTAAQWTGDPAKNPIAILQSVGPQGLDNESVNWLIDNGYDLTTGKRSDNGGLKSYVSSGMKTSNPIDQAWTTVADSKWFKGLDPKKQTEMKAMFDVALSGGELPYDVDENGDLIPKPTDEVSGAFTGDPFGADAAAILSDSKNSKYKAVVDAAVAQIKATNDVSAYNNMEEGPAKKAISTELAKGAKAWAGAISATAPGNDKTGGKDKKFINPPAAGQIIKYKGKVYLVDSDAIAVTKRGKKNKYNHQTIQLRDLETGDVYQLATWDNNLSKVA